MSDDQGAVDVDLLVAGSGGAGLVAALAAAVAGKKVAVVEKLPMLGGSTAISGGALWIPNNPLQRAAGGHDSFDAAWRYLDGLIGDLGPATSDARKRAFIEQGSRMLDFLCENGIDLAYCKDYPDYYASKPGGALGGRSIESPVYDGRKLNGDLARLNRRAIMPDAAMFASELPMISNGLRGWSSVGTMLGVLWRTLKGRAIGKPLTMGMAIVAQLIQALRQHGVEIISEAPILQLTTDGEGRVTGAVVGSSEGERVVRARCGVLLATGGFSHNPAMRARWQPAVTGQWTLSSPGDDGDGISLGIKLGAAVAQMDEAWWMPTSIMPDGQRLMCAFERAKPHSIIVDAAGERFCNEAASYMEVGQRILRRQAERGGAVPCWLILDARNRRRYPFGLWPAGYTPKSAIENGYIVRARTLLELARRCAIDADGLQQTVDRFNRMSVNGRDEDFHRGDDPYDCLYGDPFVKPNASLGGIERAPFYAVALYPGDIGTNGGLLTDEHARVLREDGSPIAGLYAAGNCTASVMGRVYPGAGGTIGPAMVFGFIGARHAVGSDL